MPRAKSDEQVQAPRNAEKEEIRSCPRASINVFNVLVLLRGDRLAHGLD